MQLGDDDALGSVDDEGPGLGHEGQLAEVELLLLDVADPPLLALPLVEEDEAEGHLERHGVGQAALATVGLACRSGAGPPGCRTCCSVGWRWASTDRTPSTPPLLSWGSAALMRVPQCSQAMRR